MVIISLYLCIKIVRQLCTSFIMLNNFSLCLITTNPGHSPLRVSYSLHFNFFVVVGVNNYMCIKTDIKYVSNFKVTNRKKTN